MERGRGGEEEGVNGKSQSGGYHNFFAAIFVGQVDEPTAKRQTYGWTNRRMDRQTEKWTDRQMDGWTDRGADSQIDGLTNRGTD